MNFAKEIQQLPSLMKDSAHQFKHVRSLCGCSMLTALNMVLHAVRIVITNLLEISFSSLAIAVAALYYGPIMTGVAGIIADTLNYLIRPSGPYFPGFAINAFLTGVIYGCFFYKQKSIHWKRVILARLSITVIINLILTPLWLYMLYGSVFFAVPRIIKNIVMFPIDTWLLYMVLKTALRVAPKYLTRT